MLELLGAWGGYAGTYVGSGQGMPELLWAYGGVRRNFSEAQGGGMPEVLGAQRGGMLVLL